MRILFLLTQSLESPGGAGRFFPLAKELVKLGHEVTLAALHHDFKHLKNRSFVRDGVKVRYVAQMHVHKSGSRKQYFGVLKLLWVTAVATIQLTISALTEETDLIHVCKAQPMNGVAAWVAHKFRKIPVYLDADDFEAGNNRFTHKWQQKIVAAFENWFPSFVRGITVNNSFIANHFINLGFSPQKVIMVPNGVDADYFGRNHTDIKILQEIKKRLNISETTKVVVYVGSISLVGHPIDLLLEAFAIVVKHHKDVVLVLVGGGEDLDAMRNMADDLGIQQVVRFVGKIAIAETVYYYQMADITVDPRRNTIAAESSLSLKLVESIVTGTPCVTTNIGDRRELIGLAGDAVPPDDPNALAQSIIRFLDDSAYLERAKVAAEDLRDSLFWSERVKDFVKVYDL